MEGHTIIVGNLAEDDRLDIRENAMKAGINSLVSIPLKLVGRVMGILQVYCRRPRSFTAEEIEFLTALANHGAVALENAQMHEHFKSEYDRLVDDIYVWHDWTSYIIRE
jgi:GAF domain-containing protein